MKYADRVKEATTTTGTGTVNLGGAASGSQSFVAGIGTTNQCIYCIEDSSTGDWEVGVGTVTSGSPDTLSRSMVLSSSNAGALVSFAAGTKTVFCVNPAALARASASTGLLGSPVPPTAEDREFNDSNADSWQNQSPATVAYGDSLEVFTLASGGGTGYHYKKQSITSPSGDYTYRARCWWEATSDSGGLGGGLILRESGTNKLVFFGPYRSTGSPNYQLVYGRTTSDTTGLSGTGLVNHDLNNQWVFRRPIILELGRSGSNVFARYSLGDGGAWRAVASEALTGPFTAAPDEWGRGVTDQGVGAGFTLTFPFSWARRAA